MTPICLWMIHQARNELGDNFVHPLYFGRILKNLGNLFDRTWWQNLILACSRLPIFLGCITSHIVCDGGEMWLLKMSLYDKLKYACYDLNISRKEGNTRSSRELQVPRCEGRRIASNRRRGAWWGQACCLQSVTFVLAKCDEEPRFDATRVQQSLSVLNPANLHAFASGGGPAFDGTKHSQYVPSSSPARQSFEHLACVHHRSLARSTPLSLRMHTSDAWKRTWRA